MRGAETQYTVSEQELLALVEGIKANHTYLSHRPLDVFTDHRALKWLHNIKPIIPRLSHWALLLQEYQYVIHHHPGTQIQHTDSLSRRPYPPCPDENVAEEIDEKLVLSATSGHGHKLLRTDIYFVEPIKPLAQDPPILATLQDMDTPTLIAAQKAFPDFIHIYAYLMHDQLPPDKSLARKMVIEAEQYILDDRVLYHLYTPRLHKKTANYKCIRQLALPRTLRAEVLEAYHNSLCGGAHLAFERSYNCIREKYFWPRQYSLILSYVKTCDTCQKAKRHYHSHQAPLQPIPVIDKFERWHMDILGPLSPGPNSDKYIKF